MATTPASRLRAARERAGLEIAQIAEQVELPFAHYRDLEDFDEDLWDTVSLRTLRDLARALHVTPHDILEGDGAPRPEGRLSAAQFVAVILKAVAASGGDVEAWGEGAGWDVAPLLEDPENVWDLNAEGLRDIANAAGVDWRAVLSDS